MFLIDVFILCGLLYLYLSKGVSNLDKEKQSKFVKGTLFICLLKIFSVTTLAVSDITFMDKKYLTREERSLTANLEWSATLLSPIWVTYYKYINNHRKDYNPNASVNYDLNILRKLCFERNERCPKYLSKIVFVYNYHATKKEKIKLLPEIKSSFSNRLIVKKDVSCNSIHFLEGAFLGYSRIVQPHQSRGELFYKRFEKELETLMKSCEIREISRLNYYAYMNDDYKIYKMSRNRCTSVNYSETGCLNSLMTFVDILKKDISLKQKNRIISLKDKVCKESKFDCRKMNEMHFGK